MQYLLSFFEINMAPIGNTYKVILLLLLFPISESIRPGRTTEARRARRIAHQSHLPVEMYLPLPNAQTEALNLCICYLICLITIAAAGGITLALDKEARLAMKRIFCFWCCCCYCFGHIHDDTLEDRQNSGDSDDSEDEMCCFRVSESIKKKRPVFVRTKPNEHSYQSQKLDKYTFKTRQSKFFAGLQVPLPTNTGNYKQKDNVLKIRLEFLADLAAYLSAQSLNQMVAVSSSSSEESEDTIHSVSNQGENYKKKK